ncbi:MAG: DUF4241 domain-containing protein [bacterium]
MYKRVGYCAVDSGQLIITDPAYLDHFKFDADDADKNLTELGNGFEYSYSGCMAATMSRKLAGQLVGWGWSKLSEDEQKFVRAGKLAVSGAFDSAGVAVDTGFGDGVYPVYVEYKNGRIKTVKIEFF